MGRACCLLLVILLAAGVLLPAAQAQEGREERLVSFHGPVPLVGAAVGGARVLDSFPFAGVALVEGPPSALAQLVHVPGVAGVYRDEPLAFSLDRSRDVVNAGASSARADWPTGSGVAIAVVDSGIDLSHPAFEERVVASVRVTRAGAITPDGGDDDGHGTHIAGILAGSGAGSVGARHQGLAPEASLVAVDISDSFTTTTAVRAFEWIHKNREAHGIRVVSNSWGREKADAHYDADDPVIRASNALVADGLVVVFSAGNRGRDGAMTLTTEAMNPNVIAVGAASASGRPEAYSSRGPARDASGASLDWVKPDLVAPGTGIVSTRTAVNAPPNARSDEERYYTVMNGTSMAAPHVAAAAALLLDVDASLSPALVAAILTGTARDVGARGADPDTGHGMLDVGAAIDAVRTLDAGARTVVLEREIPIRHEGSATALGGLIVVAGGDVRAPPEESIVIPLAFPPNAARLDLRFSWSGPGAYEVELVGADGTRRAFTSEGASSARLATPIAAGSYQVVARAEGVAASTTYVLDGALVVREESVVDMPAEFHARSYMGAAGFFETRSGARRLLDAPLDMHAMMLATSVLSLLGIGVLTRRGKR